MISFALLEPNAAELLGWIPGFLDEGDPRPFAEQLDEGYAHGGGWRPMQGWKFDARTGRLHYPGDDPLTPIAVAYMRGERLLVYPYAWVVIAQRDGSFEVARMD